LRVLQKLITCLYCVSVSVSACFICVSLTLCVRAAYGLINAAINESGAFFVGSKMTFKSLD